MLKGSKNILKQFLKCFLIAYKNPLIHYQKFFYLTTLKKLFAKIDKICKFSS